MISKETPILLAVFLFPLLSVTIEHGGSVIYLFLLLFSLFFGWKSWKDIELWEKKILFGFLIFIVVISVSFLHTQEIYLGIRKIERYLHFLFFIPMYLLLKKYQVEVGKIYFLGVVLSAFVLSGQAYYQTSILGWHRAAGAYNSLILGDVSMLVVMVTLSAFLTVFKTWKHYLLGVFVIAAALFASVMSGARGAWLLLPIMLLWFLWDRRKQTRPIQLVSIIVAFLLLILASYNIPFVKNRVDITMRDYQEYVMDTTKKSSIQTRLALWQDSIKIWKENPLIGTGVGDFHHDVSQLMDKKLSDTQVAYGHAHSIYFDVLATSGLLGLMALLLFLVLVPFVVFQSFWKKEDDPWVRFYALSGMATIIAFAVFGLTEAWLSRNPFVRTYLMSILVFMSSIAVIKGQSKTVNPN